jgi:zinc transporter ZupT
MTNLISPFLAVVLGVVIVALWRPKQLRYVKILLAFSGAFLLSITVFELLPNVFSHNQSSSLGLWIMGGILIQILLESLTKGAEHGHMHINKQSGFPWGLFVGLCLHAFLEGMPIEQHEHLIWGVLVHKLPIAIIISYFLWNSHIARPKMWFFLCLFALMTPLGTWSVHTFEALQQYTMEMSAFVIGIFLHVSTTILFESTEEHRFDTTKLLAIITAILLAYTIQH